MKNPPSVQAGAAGLQPSVQTESSLPRNSMISIARKLNTSVDSIFYDTQALSPEEQVTLSDHNTPQGFILIVYPREYNKSFETMHTWEFVDAQKDASGPEVIDTIAVAGVGSSALGTTALCRNIADYIGRPVAGVVSGFGLSDVIAEAFGGWFVFGMHNRMRDAMARTLKAFGISDPVRSQKSHERIKDYFANMGVNPDMFIFGSPDSTALLYILSELGSKIKLLVGHSKGSLSIENAIEGLNEAARLSKKQVKHLPEIVTLGAVTYFDPECDHLYQYLGLVDVLGMMNSRWDVNCVRVPGVWHSLNSFMPGYMSVASSLKDAGVQGEEAKSGGASPNKSH